MRQFLNQKLFLEKEEAFFALCEAPQCDQIGWFLTVLGKNVACISSPKTLVTFWAFM